MAKKKNPEVEQWLEKYKVNRQCTLQAAVDQKNLPILKVLLDLKANVNARGKDGQSVMSYVHNLETVELLIKYKADVNIPDTLHGRLTPLHTTACLGKEDAVQALIESHADVNETDAQHWSALMWAAIKGRTEIVKLLLSGKAEVDCKNFEGSTPLLEAATNGHTSIVKILINARADTDGKKNDHGATPLIAAVLKKRIDTVQYLLDQKADPCVIDAKGNSALNYCDDHSQLIKLILSHIAMYE